MDTVQLLDDLDATFNVAELKELCLRLKVDYENLAGESRRLKIQELILYLQRRGRDTALVQALVEARPHLAEKYGLPPAGLEKTAVTRPTRNAAAQPSGNVAEPLPAKSAGDRPDETATPVASNNAIGSNPYVFGPRITDKAMFFGRDEERQRLRANLLNMGSSSIVGLRRIGKSSLLHYLCHYEMPADQYFLFAYLDLQAAEHHTRLGLLNEILRQWSQKTGRPQTPAIDLAGFSRQVKALRQEGWRPVICLDEFERLTMRPQEFNDDVFEAWRALGNAGEAAFVTSSLSSLGELIQQSGLTSNFDNIFLQVDLGLLTEPAARALVVEPAARQGLELPVATIDRLLDWAGRYPFYLQMASFYYFNALQSGMGEPDRVRSEFEREAARHWQGLWRALSVAEQAALRAIVGKALPGPAAATHLRTLERKGVVSKVDNEYEPFGQGFATFVTAVPIAETAAPPVTPEPREESQLTPTVEEVRPAKRVINPALLYALIFLLLLIVSALVLRFVFDQQDFLALSVLLAIGLTFALVGADKLTGQEFLGWLRELLGKR